MLVQKNASAYPSENKSIENLLSIAIDSDQRCAFKKNIANFKKAIHICFPNLDQEILAYLLFKPGYLANTKVMSILN